jgi:hypothetical protein
MTSDGVTPRHGPFFSSVVIRMIRSTSVSSLSVSPE